MNLQFIPNSCFSGGEDGAHFARILADVGKFEKRKIAKPLVFKGLAIACRVELVPRAGVEPARVAPLVFETSASTDSAIWAFCGAKIHIIF